jgi:hypothetical protein
MGSPVYTEENEPEQENVNIFSYSKYGIFIYHIIQNQITSYVAQLRRWVGGESALFSAPALLQNSPSQYPVVTQ